MLYLRNHFSPARRGEKLLSVGAFLLALCLSSTIATSRAAAEGVSFASSWSVEIIEATPGEFVAFGDGLRLSLDEPACDDGSFSFASTWEGETWEPRPPVWNCAAPQVDSASQVDLDRLLGILELPRLVGTFTGSDIQAGLEPGFFEEGRVKFLGVSVELALDRDSNGKVINLPRLDEVRATETTKQLLFRDTEEDATDFVRQTLLDMGFGEEPVEQFINAELTVEELIDTFSTPRMESGGDDPNDGSGPSKEEVNDALKNVKFKIQIEGGVSTDALKVTVAVESDLHAMKTLALAYSEQQRKLVERMYNLIRDRLPQNMQNIIDQLLAFWGDVIKTLR